jgi:hypothetical protein
MVTGAELEVEIVGESVKVSVVVFVLAVAIAENIVEDGLADVDTVVVTFAAMEAKGVLFCSAHFMLAPRPV